MNAVALGGAALVFLSANVLAEDWLQKLDSARRQAAQTVAAEEERASRGAGLGAEEIAAGLREALSGGVKKAVASLGVADGFLKAADVRIPLPEKLRTAERAARKLGMGRYADEFDVTLNRAAEEAVPEAAAVFADAVRKMTLADARGILNGPEDAATRYFRETSAERLTERFLPVVKRATRRAGATRAYDAFRDKTGPLTRLTGAPPDLDRYVAQKALDALFARVAAEERVIRRDPAGQASALLRKVFGAAAR